MGFLFRVFHLALLRRIRNRRLRNCRKKRLRNCNSSIAEQRRDWSMLPGDVLHLISMQLGRPLYLTRFRSVCRTWRSSTPRHLDHPLPNLHLEFVYEFNEDSWLSKHSLYLLRPHQEGPRQPWLINMSEDGNLNQLWHPIVPHFRFDHHLEMINFMELPVISLGHHLVLHDNQNLFMEKVAAATWQGDDHFVIIPLFDLEACAWYSHSESRFHITILESKCDDICVFKGRPCLVYKTGMTIMFNPDMSLELMAASVDLSGIISTKHLVVSQDKELLLVCHYFAGCSDRAFGVFSLDENERIWVELNNLGDPVIFLGDNCTFIASASDLNVTQGNSLIYYQGGYTAYSNGMRIYQFDQHQLSNLSDFPEYAGLFWPPPDWLHAYSM